MTARWRRAVQVPLLVAPLLCLGVAGCGGDDTTARADATIEPSDEAVEVEVGEVAGSWGAHGRGIDIAADGSFELTFRTYAVCGVDAPPCDRHDDDRIWSGGEAAGRLERRSGDAWTGTMTESNHPEWYPLGPVTVTWDPATDTIDFVSGSTEVITFCGVTRDGPDRDLRCGA